MSSVVERSQQLHLRVRAWIRAWTLGNPSSESFDALASDLARFQAESIPGVRRLMVARGVNWTKIARMADVPGVPTDAFKMAELSAFPESETPFVFRTSGTTIGARGVHRLRDVGTYDEGAIAFGRKHLVADHQARLPILVIGPPPDEAADSSLSHMIGLFVREFGERTTISQTYFLRGGELDLDGLQRRIDSSSGQATLVLGTSFAFVHLLDSLDGRKLPLGEGSRLMQTGGYKGRTREVPPAELRRSLADAFAIRERAIVSEYGMTELSSQFYEGTLSGGLEHGVYVEPPWAKVVPVCPETHAPVADGEIGIGRIIDLLNIDSPSVIQTQDRVRRVPGGFELLGRQKTATPRGCSIGIDELLAK